MAAQIMIEVAPGELIDKITILEIKLENMTDTAKLANVRHELDVLAAARDAAISASDDLDYLTGELKRVNLSLWQIEDDIRDCERANDFGEAFVELARAVYKTNDLRAALKRKINELLDSPIFEEKSYAPY
ncbi:DUF6165 family protein [Radicibacter daui]|uniref:DUF6165 family protein n=1 Tax=Radicibacter daui TaxID=3064829 RepID=UPI004046BFF1